MAVTLTSYPPLDLLPKSVSYPFVVEMNSTVYGTAGVTQHRFVANVNGSVAYGYIGDKYTVAFDDLGNGRFDFSRMLQAVILLDYKDETAEEDLTKITDPQGLRVQEAQACTIVIKEQYYLNGVYTENTATPSLLIYAVARGWTDLADYEYYFQHWWEFNGLERFQTYSGYLPYLNYVDAHNPNFVDDTTNPWLGIIVRTWPGPVTHGWWVERDDYFAATYYPIYFPGETDQTDFEKVQVWIYTSPIAGVVGGTLEEDFDIYRTVNPCEDEERLIMFQNRFNEWSFLSFSLKSYTSISTNSQKATRIEEAEPPGRFRYNVEAADTLILNTDWLTEDQNDLVRDLLETNTCFLVNQDGSLEQVVIQDNAKTLKTRRNDELFKYTMRFKKSLDNFSV